MITDPTMFKLLFWTRYLLPELYVFLDDGFRRICIDGLMRAFWVSPVLRIHNLLLHPILKSNFMKTSISCKWVESPMDDWHTSSVDDSYDWVEIYSILLKFWGLFYLGVRVFIDVNFFLSKPLKLSKCSWLFNHYMVLEVLRKCCWKVYQSYKDTIFYKSVIFRALQAQNFYFPLESRLTYVMHSRMISCCRSVLSADLFSLVTCRMVLPMSAFLWVYYEILPRRKPWSICLLSLMTCSQVWLQISQTLSSFSGFLHVALTLAEEIFLVKVGGKVALLRMVNLLGMKRSLYSPFSHCCMCWPPPMTIRLRKRLCYIACLSCLICRQTVSIYVLSECNNAVISWKESGESMCVFASLWKIQARDFCSLAIVFIFCH